MRHLAGVVLALAHGTLSCVLEAQQAPAPRAMIRDSVGRSIPYATVQSSGSTPRVANDSGVVLLSVPRADSLKLLVRRIGFQAWEGWVRPDAAGDFVVRLTPLPQNLARVSIYERDTPLARTGFYDRMERVANSAVVARFWTPEAIEARNPNRTSVLMEGENIVRVRTMSGKPVLTGRGGTCPMGIVVDGQRLNHTVEEISTREGEEEILRIARQQRVGREQAERIFLYSRESIDELVNSLAVVAVEIYASMASVPAELQRLAPPYACGLVVVWTGRRG